MKMEEFKHNVYVKILNLKQTRLVSIPIFSQFLYIERIDLLYTTASLETYNDVHIFFTSSIIVQNVLRNLSCLAASSVASYHSDLQDSIE